MWIEIVVYYGRFGGYSIGSVKVHDGELELDEGFERTDEYGDIVSKVVVSSSLVKDVWVKRFEDMDIVRVKVGGD